LIWNGTGRTVIETALAAMLVTTLVVWGTLRQRARERVLRRFDALVAAHLPALRRRRRQLVRVDDYGVVDRARWERELGYFLDRVVPASLGVGEVRHIRERPERFRARLEAAVAAEEPEPAAEARFQRVRTGSEFELFCAQELERWGWRVSHTGAARDQGADLLAERDGERMVVQCKLLARAIGNQAVQEVAAARAHRQATRAVVVSNRRFTAGCVELARANGVELAHWRDLAAL
jgi:restriction system protein